MELANPLVTRWILETLTDAGASLLTPVLTLVLLLIGSAALGWWQWVLLGSLAEDVVYNARASMIHRFVRGRLLPLLSRPSGELVTRVTSDSVLLREAATSSLVELLNGVVMLGGTLALMAVLDVRLTLVTVATILLVGATVAALLPGIAEAQEKAQRSLGSLGGNLEGTLRAIRTVKVAGGESRQEEALLTEARGSRTHGIAAVRREALVWTIASFGVQAAIVVVLGVGAWQTSVGQMTVPTLVAFLLYAFGLLGPVMDISTSFTTLQSGMAAASRIREVDDIELERRFIDTPQLVTADPADSPSDRTPRRDSAPAVEVDRVTVRYPDKSAPVLRNVTLTIPSIGHTAIVGPSGAGKTSLLSLLLDFFAPDTGELRLNGTPYAALSPAAIRSHFAYVEQDAPIIPGTLKTNLQYAARDASELDMVRTLRWLRLDTLVNSLPNGWDTALRDTSLSGGQRQRIAIARSLLARPAVLLLDEATAQLDGISEAAIQDAIHVYSRRASVVTIAHRLSTITTADSIVVMDEGEVSAVGTHGELIASNPLYRRLVAALSIDQEKSMTAASASTKGDFHADL